MQCLSGPTILHRASHRPDQSNPEHWQTRPLDNSPFHRVSRATKRTLSGSTTPARHGQRSALGISEFRNSQRFRFKPCDQKNLGNRACVDSTVVHGQTLHHALSHHTRSIPCRSKNAVGENPQTWSMAHARRTGATRLRECPQKNPGSPVALKPSGHVRQIFGVPTLAQVSRTVYSGFKSTPIAAPI